jgi:iron-sulfur cluster insertion protein
MLDNITVTDAARSQIDTIAKQHPGKHVRLAITSGGCNGFSKVWSLDDSVTNEDIIINCFDSILLIDQTSLEILLNCTIDYRKDLMGSMFTVDIPAAVSGCGCGTSFSL